MRKYDVIFTDRCPYTYVWSGTTVSFRNGKETVSPNIYCRRHKYRHYGIMWQVINMLITNGWTIKHDRTVAKCIRRDYFVGRKGSLKFKAERYPVGFKFEFYQDIITENKNGGYYDSDKFNKMPYLIQKQFIQTQKRIDKLIAAYAENRSDPETKTAEDKIKLDYVKSSHKPQTNTDFDLFELDGTEMPSYANIKDRDGKEIRNGDFKYFRDCNGYLQCGKVYHNINNMIWVITNDTTVRNIACFELFDLTDGEPRRRVKKRRIPQSYAEKKNILRTCSVKELKKELKRRKVRV